MKIYTRTGDNGITGLFGGPRVSKDDVRIEAYGTVDELNASLGVARASGLGEQIDEQLEIVQHELFAMGAELSAPDPVAKGLRWLGPTQTGRLERWIDEHEDSLPKLTNFVLPSGTSGACFLHLARGVCRRAERRLVTLSHQVPGAVSDDLIVYLNRLSDLLFVLSRVVNQTSGVSDVMWVGLARDRASQEKRVDP